MEPEQVLSATQFQFSAAAAPFVPRCDFEHFKVTVHVTQVLRSPTDQPSLHAVEYIVTQEGLLNSPRIPQNGFIHIGRQQINDEGRIPNDVMLPPSDRAISRCHCKLDYRQWFHNRRLPDEYVAFLMAGHTRLGISSSFRNLPAYLFGYVYSFLKAQHTLWLTDLGSVCGTYVKVSHDQPVALQPGQCFLIGSDIVVEVDEVCCNVLHSLPSEESEDSLTLRNETQPSIKVTISRISDNEESTLHRHSQMFVAEQPSQAFLIGRSNTCDIKLNDSTISRVQCRIVFQRDSWYMFDGQDTKSSVNGTWLSVCKQERRPREESLPFPVANGSQIKISDTVLQISWAGTGLN